jgi:hypothetical protein
VVEELSETYEKVISDDGYVFAQGKMPVLLVAHLDTVHKQLPQIVYYDEKTQIISSPEGIGGDDRCGVYMVLEVIKRYNCSVLFCEDEEIGAVGAKKFTKSIDAKDLEWNYIIEFDRRGSDDAVFYDCDNPKFEDFITESFYKSSFGSFSDISVLAPFFKCAAVNLSCGYYKAHTVDEYVVFPEMVNSIHAACSILERTTEEDKFEYIEAKHSYRGYSSYDDFFGYVDDGYGEYYIEYINENGDTELYCAEGMSDIEAIGDFCMAHPNLTFNHVIDIYPM